jgi:hypothetical protein
MSLVDLFRMLVGFVRHSCPDTFSAAGLAVGWRGSHAASADAGGGDMPGCRRAHHTISHGHGGPSACETGKYMRHHVCLLV